jgi:hypothetical protein
MRRLVWLVLCLLPAACVPPAPDNMSRVELPPQTAATDMPPPMTAPARPAVGYGAAMPTVPKGGLGPEAPMPKPRAAQMPTIGPGVPASSTTTSANQSIVVPNGNGTSTIIHPDGTTETVPTPK